MASIAYRNALVCSSSAKKSILGLGRQSLRAYSMSHHVLSESYPRISIRGTPLPDVVGDHSWGGEALADNGEKLRENTWRDRMEAAGGQREITHEVYAECPDGVRDLVDELLSLNRIDIERLLQQLQSRLGVTDEMKWATPLRGDPEYGSSIAFGGGGGGATSGDDSAAAGKDSFDIKITAFTDGSKIKIIKEVRAATGLGLKEAKALVDGIPSVIQKDLSAKEAEDLKAILVGVGAIVEII